MGCGTLFLKHVTVTKVYENIQFSFEKHKTERPATCATRRFFKEKKTIFFFKKTTSRTSRGLGVAYLTKLRDFGHNLSYLEPVLGWSWACLGLSRSVCGLSWACLEHYSAEVLT